MDMKGPHEDTATRTPQAVKERAPPLPQETLPHTSPDFWPPESLRNKFLCVISFSLWYFNLAMVASKPDPI